MELVRQLAASAAEDLQDEAALLAAWNGEVSTENRSAALAILTAQRARGYLLNDEGAETPDYETALRETSAALTEKFGRIDPPWGEVVRLNRGGVSLALNGGPDTLRAVYPDAPNEKGVRPAVGGDTYILYADWSGARDVEIKTIHQFGSATKHRRITPIKRRCLLRKNGNPRPWICNHCWSRPRAIIAWAGSKITRRRGALP